MIANILIAAASSGPSCTLCAVDTATKELDTVWIDPDDSSYSQTNEIGSAMVAVYPEAGRQVRSGLAGIPMWSGRGRILDECYVH